MDRCPHNVAVRFYVGDISIDHVQTRKGKPYHLQSSLLLGCLLRKLFKVVSGIATLLQIYDPLCTYQRASFPSKYSCRTIVAVRWLPSGLQPGGMSG